MQGSRQLVFCALLSLTLAPGSSQGPNGIQGMGEKSQKKCREYGELVYEKQSVASLFPDDEPTITQVRECGIPTGQDLITGGEAALPNEFPHMAALGYGVERDISWLCGGSLISENFVLTAAHCLGHRQKGPVRWVMLGDFNLVSTTNRGDPQQFSVTGRIRHPGYKHPSIYNDVALLKLDRDAKMGKYVRPACLNVHRDIGRHKALATGWGRTTADGVGGSAVLMKVALDLVPGETCGSALKSVSTEALKMGVQDETMVCAGVEEGHKDSCSGDSGGPLQTLLTDPDCMYNIIGVTSFGILKCGTPKFPAIYTRVSNYIPWIESVVWP